MRYERSSTILLLLNLLYSPIITVKGKPTVHQTDIKSTIKDLRHDIHKVLNYIDHLNEDVLHGVLSDSQRLGNSDKSRSVIPYQGEIKHLLADESVIKATANKAAKAVADSTRATLKTQKGVKQISRGLVTLKNCLEAFEKTIKL